MEANAELEELAGGAVVGRGFCRRAGCGGVAFRKLPNDSSVGEPLLRHDVFRLQLTLVGRRSPAPVRRRAARACPLPRIGDCDGLRHDRHLDRAGLRGVDAKGPTLKVLRTAFILVLLFPMSALAHVGNKDVFQQVTAGPYKLFVTVRMPNVIPGVANVEVRSTGAPVSSLKITPLPITGEASKHPPTPDTMKVSTVDPAFYTGGVWMMSSGSWQVRIYVSGAAGDATVSVPVPAVAIATLQMKRDLGVPLSILGLFLVISMAGVIAA